MRRAMLISAAGLVVASLMQGCTHNQDVGDSGGRINPYASTGADAASPEANMPAMLEYSDQVAEALVRRLGEIPEIAGAPTKVVVELGSIENLTNTPRTDFEMIQRRLRGRLINSDIATAKLRFVESVAAMDAEQWRVQGGDTGAWQGGYETGGTDRYEPINTYVLRGAFFESERYDTHRFYFEFNLVNLQTRDIVFNEPFDLAQQTQ